MGFYKKTLTLITIFLTITSHVATACSCSAISSFISSAEYSQNTIQGIVVKHIQIKPSDFNLGYSAVLFQIEKEYKGESQKDTVLIAESTGFECYSSKFQDGKSYFVNGSFSLINEIDSNGYVNIVNEILIPSECAESTIQINEDEVCGKISINPSKFNSWFYRIIGKLKKKESRNHSVYIECMTVESLRKRLQNMKFKN